MNKRPWCLKSRAVEGGIRFLSNRRVLASEKCKKWVNTRTETFCAHLKLMLEPKILVRLQVVVSIRRISCATDGTDSDVGAGVGPTA